MTMCMTTNKKNDCSALDMHAYSGAILACSFASPIVRIKANVELGASALCGVLLFRNLASS